MGNTDPNAFAASGRFKLDSFLLSENAAGTDSPLSSVFNSGVTWAQVFAGGTFQATSTAYDITQLSLQSDASGSFSVSAVPVPEPQTWALWLAGLFMLAAKPLLPWRKLGPATKPAHITRLAPQAALPHPGVIS